MDNQRLEEAIRKMDIQNAKLDLILNPPKQPTTQTWEEKVKYYGDWIVNKYLQKNLRKNLNK